MAQVEDVAHVGRTVPHYSPGRISHDVPGGEAGSGIEIPLKGLRTATPPGGFAQRDPPVHSQDIRAGFNELAKKLTGPDPEVDHRHPEVADPFEDPLG